MFPYLFKGALFGHTVNLSTYGVLLAIGFSQSYFFTSRLASRRGIEQRHVDNLFLLIMASAIVGGRLFHVLFENFAFFVEHPAKIFAVWEKGSSGFTFYGSFLTAMAVVVWYCRRHEVDFPSFADCAAPPIGLGLAIGRFACFCAGCCWGTPTSCFLAVTFTRPDSFAGVKNVPLHPVQLYGATTSLLGFFYLYWRFHHRRYRGQLLAHGLVLYSASRFLFETFRGDDYRGYVLGGTLSISQAISLVILPCAVWLARRLRDRDRDEAAVVGEAERHAG